MFSLFMLWLGGYIASLGFIIMQEGFNWRILIVAMFWFVFVPYELGIRIYYFFILIWILSHKPPSIEYYKQKDREDEKEFSDFS